MSLNDLADEFKQEISGAAVDLTNSLPLSKPTIREAFTDGEIEQVGNLIRLVNDATDENEKQKALAQHAGAVLVLLRRLGIKL